MSRNIQIGITIAITLAIAGSAYYLYAKYDPFSIQNSEVHVHSDFVIVLNDRVLDLTDQKYQSSARGEKHSDIHLHDGKDHVVHRHAEGVTFVEFLASLGITLTERCITLDTAESFCQTEEEALVLFVNKEPVSNPLTYVNQEEDKILLYFGRPDNTKLETYLTSITDESCIFSGTCPERGTAPPESCGLTCEL